MPIYAYKCGACGHARDVLQKMSDPLLSVCPACGAQSFAKQVTAAGFQLKGSGWYATDFKGSTGPAAEKGSNGSATAGAAAPAVTETSKPAPAAGAAAPAASSGVSGAA